MSISDRWNTIHSGVPATSLCKRYSESIKGTVPASTFDSQTNTIREFASYCEENGLTVADLSINTAVWFVDELETRSDKTIIGQVASIANLLAFAWQQDPKIIQARVAAVLKRSHGRVYPELNPAFRLDEGTRDQIETVLEWMRRSRYGTRLHAVSALMLAAHVRPGDALMIDEADVDFDASSIRIRLPQTHLIGKNEFISHRTAELGDTLDVLETYRQYSQADAGTDAFFTTPRGRLSDATFYRNIRSNSQRVLTDGAALTPKQLWRYSFTHLDP